MHCVLWIDLVFLSLFFFCYHCAHDLHTLIAVFNSDKWKKKTTTNNWISQLLCMVYPSWSINTSLTNCRHIHLSYKYTKYRYCVFWNIFCIQSCHRFSRFNSTYLHKQICNHTDKKKERKTYTHKYTHISLQRKLRSPTHAIKTHFFDIHKKYTIYD